MAEEGGSEINVGMGQASIDSTESRWVFQDEDDSEIDEDDDVSQRSVAAGGLDSEDEDDNAEQRLIRTGPRIDSFDVEALEVPGALRNDYEVEVASGVLVRCAFLLCESTVNEICLFNFTLFRSILFLVTVWLLRKENWIRIVWFLLVFLHFTRMSHCFN
jgi:hypothetical protein